MDNKKRMFTIVFINYKCYTITTSLMEQCKLNAHLHEVDKRAKKMYDRLVKQLKEQQGVTEQLKSDDMMAWVQAMNSITNQAREIVYNEVIYMR